tara:strand:+ start:1214 stop:2275 length:1062 start_codon:yes stop_codon:yes gene_type:complete
MKSNLKFFKKKRILPIDEFFHNVLYDKKIGYYNSKSPFGEKGDFVTSPKISKIFSEIIAIWIVSTWEAFGRPKNFNIVELGPGDASLTNILLKVFKKFPKFNSSKNIFLYEKSEYLKKKQKNLLTNKVKWIKDFTNIKKGPVIFFGNEFFDAIPIKQFKREGKVYFEKYYTYDKRNKIKEIFKPALEKDTKIINSLKSLKNLKFIEFPKEGLEELKKISNIISKFNGCILMIDYGYLKPNNKNTLQSVIRHSKNNIFKNLGKADITCHVNFSLLNEYFVKKNLKVKKIITQNEFLNKMGIFQRAEIISKNMKFTEKADLYLRLKRLLSPQYMGELFKVILAYKSQINFYNGFK